MSSQWDSVIRMTWLLRLTDGFQIRLCKVLKMVGNGRRVPVLRFALSEVMNSILVPPAKATGAGTTTVFVHRRQPSLLEVVLGCAYGGNGLTRMVMVRFALLSAMVGLGSVMNPHSAIFWGCILVC